MLDSTNKAMAQLRLMQLVSPSLPTGGYSYSQGLEWAVEAGWMADESDFVDWLKGLLSESITQLDLPVLKRLYLACDEHDRTTFALWCDVLFASRETRELREEEHNRARAMTRLLIDLDIPLAGEWKNTLTVCHAAPFALAASCWKITIHNTLLGYAWSWLENQTAAGIKLIPLGQTTGQRILNSLSADLELAVDTAMQVTDENIGAGTPALALASSQHETQYSRLFRS